MSKYDYTATMYTAPGDPWSTKDPVIDEVKIKYGEWHDEYNGVCFYRDIINVFSAIRYTGSNDNQIVKFTGEEKLKSENGLKIYLHIYSGKKGVVKTAVELNIGDWIVKEAFSSTYCLCGHDEFMSRYKIIK